MPKNQIEKKTNFQIYINNIYIYVKYTKNTIVLHFPEIGFRAPNFDARAPEF